MIRLQDRYHWNLQPAQLLVGPLLLWLAGCSTVVVEENKFEPVANESGEFTVVVLGRHESSNYDTEEDLGGLRRQ